MKIDSNELINQIMYHDYFPCTIDENANKVVFQIIQLIHDLESNVSNI
jgi:hypothetical protein